LGYPSGGEYQLAQGIASFTSNRLESTEKDAFVEMLDTFLSPTPHISKEDLQLCHVLRGATSCGEYDENDNDRCGIHSIYQSVHWGTPARGDIPTYPKM